MFLEGSLPATTIMTAQVPLTPEQQALELAALHEPSANQIAYDPDGRDHFEVPFRVRIPY